MRIENSHVRLALCSALIALAPAVPAAASQQSAAEEGDEDLRDRFGCDESYVCGQSSAAEPVDPTQADFDNADADFMPVTTGDRNLAISGAILRERQAKAEPSVATARPRAKPARSRMVPAKRAQRRDLGAVDVDAKVFGTDFAVTFANGTARIERSSIGEIERFAEFLKKAKGPDGEPMRVRIEGHASATGDEVRNRELSVLRAMAVREKLLEFDVAGDRLVAEGYGSSRPVDGFNATHGVNRRVEAILID